DGDPQSNGCTSDAWNATNIVDRLEAASLTWKAYMEDMPSTCYGSNSGLYAVRHDPFVYYKDIATNPTRCARVVPSGSGAGVLLAVHAFLPPLDDRGELELGSPHDERSKRAEYGGVLLRSTGRRELPAPDRLPARLGPARRLRHLPRRDRGLARPSAARHEIGPTAAAPPRTRGARRRNGFRIGSLTAPRDQTMAPPRHLRLAAVVS